MSLFSTAKTKFAKGNVKEAFKNEEGAIDLASIMVGIIVIGLIGGVIAATVFAVIPWAQDNAAKQQLDSVSAAQSAFIGLASESTAISFGDASATPAVGLADPANKLFDATTAKIKIAQQGSGTDAHYVAIKKSASGKFFYITDTKTSPSIIAGTNPWNANLAIGGTAFIPGPTTINGIIFGSAVDPDGVGPLTATNVSWTGSSAM